MVHRGLRGKGLGTALVRALTTIAQQQGCYKCILDCKEENVKFYEKLGFRRKEIQCVTYFDQEVRQGMDDGFVPPQDSIDDSLASENAGNTNDADGVTQESLYRPLSPGRAQGESLHRRLQHFLAEEREVGDGLVVRQLSETDYSKGFLSLLAQLTTVGVLDEVFFKAGD